MEFNKPSNFIKREIVQSYSLADSTDYYNHSMSQYNVHQLQSHDYLF